MSKTPAILKQRQNTSKYFPKYIMHVNVLKVKDYFLWNVFYPKGMVIYTHASTLYS